MSKVESASDESRCLAHPVVVETDSCDYSHLIGIMIINHWVLGVHYFQTNPNPSGENLQALEIGVTEQLLKIGKTLLERPTRTAIKASIKKG